MTQLEWENLASLLSLGAGGVATILLISGVIPARFIASCERRFTTIARSRVVCFILLPVLSFSMYLLIALRSGGVPIPVIHDEFSYLLAADTFAHGRVTNPTPAYWEHFETLHQLMHPTYMSKYPPGQGLALALGQIISRQPIVGVWITTAAGVAAIYWMLLGFVPPPWALLGGILAALHPQLVDWSQIYWGGSVAFLGSALVVGAWGRLMIQSTVRISLVLGIGLIILANSRPYEGLVLWLPLAISLLFKRGNRWIALLLPAGMVLLIGAVAMGYYNFRITGHVLRLPFVEYAMQYDVYPKFWFLSTRPVPVYHNPAMKFIHTEFEATLYFRLRTWHGFLDIARFRLQEMIEVNTKLAILYLPMAMALIARRKRLMWLRITTAVFLIGLWAESIVLWHYEAPVLVVLLLLIVIGWQWLAGWSWHDRPVGKMLAIATAIGFVTGAGMAADQRVDHTNVLVEQKALVSLLPRLQTGRHLIFVTYAPMHSFHIEYVHNLSSLDESPIIWARSFGPESDRQVAQHYAGRHVWLLNVGGKLDLNPYLPE